MPSVIETTTAIQDKVLEGMQVGQKAVVDVVRSWAETVETLSSKLSELPGIEYPTKPGQFVETAFGFTEKLLSSQHSFASQVFEAALPATRLPASAVRTAAAKAASKA